MRTVSFTWFLKHRTFAAEKLFTNTLHSFNFPLMSQPLTCLIMLSPKITTVFFLFTCALVRINIGTDGLRQITYSFFFLEIWLSLVVFVSHKICWLWFFLYFFSYISPGKSYFPSFCRQLLLPLTIFELFDSHHLFSIVFYMKSETKSICFLLDFVS